MQSVYLLDPINTDAPSELALYGFLDVVFFYQYVLVCRYRFIQNCYKGQRQQYAAADRRKHEKTNDYCIRSVDRRVRAAGETGGGSAKMDIKAGGKDTALAIKSSGTDKNVKTFTDKEGKVTTATSFYAMMANYDMDTTNFASMKKPLTAPEQARVMLQLIGEEGTDQKSEFKPGTYKADPAGKFMKIDSLVVTTFADGKEVVTSFDTMFSASKITGQVVVKSVTADANKRRHRRHRWRQVGEGYIYREDRCA